MISAAANAHAWLHPGAALLVAQFPLFVGMFVVFAVAVRQTTALGTAVLQADGWRAVLRGSPPWMQRLVSVVLGWALVNFGLALLLPGGGPPPEARIVSGHAMAVYAAAMGMMCAAARRDELGTARTCPAGHAATPGAGFCGRCGAATGRPAPRR